MFGKTFGFIQNFQINYLSIYNIKTKDNNALSKKFTKSTQRVIYLYFNNDFTPEELIAMKTRLYDSLNSSEIVRLEKKKIVNNILKKTYIFYKSFNSLFNSTTRI